MHLSIARSLRLALAGLTIVLVAVAVVGVTSHYHARQDYERTLTASAAVQVSGANLLTAAVTEAGVLGGGHGPGDAAVRRRAQAAFAQVGSRALREAGRDHAARRLIAQQIELQSVLRSRALSRASRTFTGAALARQSTLATRLQRYEAARQSAARNEAQSRSHRDIAIVLGAGALALIAALTLIAALVRSMRSPLDELVAATRELAEGQLERRVRPGGPRELRALGRAFNAMADDLEAAGERIESERRRLATTIESLGDGLLVCEPGSSTIATANPRARELVAELEPGESVEAAGSPLPPVDLALEREIVIEHAGRVLAVTAAPLGSRSDGIVWTVRDVTERSRLERAKSEFVATASHELRSPLTSIKGFVELLGRDADNLGDRQREFLEIILRSTDRLVELVNDLLDVARIEADRVEISRRPIDIGEAVREVAELMGPRIEQKEQTLGVHVSPALPLAMADPERIRQVVANLLTNAHLYTEPGGRIRVGVEADRAWVRIVVADSGIGMTETEREHVFDRFYRAKRSESAVRGTGLGLSIVRSLVELHDGEIEIESEPGRGSTFHVRIPAAVAGLADGDALDVIRGRRVLIVDDEREIAELIATQLAPLEVESRIARSGAEAMRALREEQFDAVTLDVLMPEMDGLEVLAQIRADQDLASIPVLFVSVFAGRGELAGEWVVAKPIDADELRRVLVAAVHGGRSRVLVVGRPQIRAALEAGLDELGIEHQWEASGPAAARVCGERRFEVALVDVGIRNPQAVLQALDLRGRRLRRAVILFSNGEAPTPPGIGRLGLEVVPVQDAPQALLQALRGDRDTTRQDQGWSSEATVN
jgi:signal transduction histidine kinase/DNA-binding response OmpR family regulator